MRTCDSDRSAQFQSIPLRLPEKWSKSSFHCANTIRLWVGPSLPSAGRWGGGGGGGGSSAQRVHPGGMPAATGAKKQGCQRQRVSRRTDGTGGTDEDVSSSVRLHIRRSRSILRATLLPVRRRRPHHLQHSGMDVKCLTTWLLLCFPLCSWLSRRHSRKRSSGTGGD